MYRYTLQGPARHPATRQRPRFTLSGPVFAGRERARRGFNSPLASRDLKETKCTPDILKVTHGAETASLAVVLDLWSAP